MATSHFSVFLCAIEFLNTFSLFMGPGVIDRKGRQIR